MERQHIFYSFLAVLTAMVVILSIVAYLAYWGKYAEALGIGGVLTGLVGTLTLLARGVPSGNSQADANLATALDKLKPTTTGTGPAHPLPVTEEEGNYVAR